MFDTTKRETTMLTRDPGLRRAVNDSHIAWCEHCLDVVLCLSPESAANALQSPLRKLFALLESGKLHLVEVGARQPLICSNSISNRTETEILVQGERQ